MKFDLNNLGSNEVDKINLCVFGKFDICEDDLSEAINSLCESEGFNLCKDNSEETEKDDKGEGVSETEEDLAITDVYFEEAVTKKELREKPITNFLKETEMKEPVERSGDQRKEDIKDAPEMLNTVFRIGFTNRFEKDSKEEEQILSWEVNYSDAEWKGKLDALIDDVFASFEYDEGRQKREEIERNFKRTDLNKVKNVNNQLPTVHSEKLKEDKTDPDLFEIKLPVLCRMLLEQNKSGEKGKAKIVKTHGLPITELFKEERSFGVAETELELKKLPEYWKHAFFDNNYTQPVIISPQLETDQKAEALEILTDYEKARDWRFFKYFPPEPLQVLGTFMTVF